MIIDQLEAHFNDGAARGEVLIQRIDTDNLEKDLIEQDLDD